MRLGTAQGGPWLSSVVSISDLVCRSLYHGTANPYLAGFQSKISGGTRCNVRNYLLSLITSALLTTSAFAQQAQQGADRIRAGPLTQITIEGKQITGDDVLVRKGTAYVSVTALAQALGASVASQGQVAVMSIPAAPEGDCRDAQSATRLSDAYRKAAVRIPDAVESLRALVNNQVAIIPATSFDKVDQQISEAHFHAQNDADRSVSYALSHANDTLAICTTSCCVVSHPSTRNRASSIPSCARWRASSPCRWGDCRARRVAAFSTPIKTMPKRSQQPAIRGIPELV